MPDEGTLAAFGGLCPICGRYIAKNRSRVEALPVEIGVQTQLWAPKLRNGWYSKGRVYDPKLDMMRRKWVHAKCLQKGLAYIESARG